MGLLKKLFGAASPPPLLYPGADTLQVVGESNYQDALETIIGGRPVDRVRSPVHATLLPDPQNPCDPNAIRIEISGLIVGHLSRVDALRYRPGLLRLLETSGGRPVALAGHIVGGGKDADGRQRMLGVFLDHDPADFDVQSLPGHHSAGFRTGFSHACTADADDDSYDLSWFGSLSENDTTAIAQLHEWLATTTSHIERHYLMCELEKRLYRCRDVFGSALAEYDATCHAHDDEMDAMAVELRTKLGSVPLLETYRQAAIRHQKAKDWPAVLWWTERGIAVYGTSIGVDGAVEDLVRRRDYAQMKIAPATTTRPAAGAVLPTVGASRVVEALVCAVCGARFERVRTRGRKPSACPQCRSA
ncbi:MAG: hypothetical protein QOE45_2006 [Frankiaceae bacterium]|jgi:hypothetical protein|nr:hypothetical protein [Frankiaceae bacterium]